MELREFGVRDPQTHAWHVPDEGLDARPVEELAGTDAPPELLRQQAPHRPTRPGVDAHHAPPALEPRELDVVGPDQPRSLDVDQLAVEHVLTQEHLARATLEMTQIEPRCLHRHDPRRELLHLLGGDERLATGHRHEKSHYGWVARLIEADDQIVHAP